MHLFFISQILLVKNLKQVSPYFSFHINLIKKDMQTSQIYSQSFSCFQIFQMAFKHTFSSKQRQSQSHSPSILSSVTRYINKHIIEQKNSLLKQHAFPHLQMLLNRIDKNRMIINPQFEFGCVFMIEKKDDDIFPNLYLIFPTQWGLGMSVHQSTICMYPLSTMKYDFCHIASIQDSVTNLQSIFSQLKHQLSNVRSQCTKNKSQDNKKNHHTPSWMYQALIESTRRMNNENKKQAKIESKGGTLDVGQHTGITKPDVVYGAIWATIAFLLGDDQLYRALQISYKTQLLYQQSKKLNSSSYILQCMRQLRSDYSNLLQLRNEYFDSNKAQEFFSKISRNINRLENNQKSCYTDEQLGKIAIENVYEFNDNQWIPSVTNLNCRKQTLDKNSIYTISKDRIFQSLFQYLDILELKQWINLFEETIFTIATNQLKSKTNFQFISINTQGIYTECILLKLLKKYDKKIDYSIKISGSRSLNSQYHSHRQLVKCIFAIISFEKYKRKYKSTNQSVENYQLPIKYDRIFDNFNSLSYIARCACYEVMRYYDLQKNKNSFFNLDFGYQNYSVYAIQSNKNAKNIVKIREKKLFNLKQKIENLKNTIRKYIQQLQRYQKKVIDLQNQGCSCHFEQYQQYKYRRWGNSQYVTKQRYVTCSRCQDLKSARNTLSQHKQKKQKQILSVIPQNHQQIDIHTFFEQMNQSLIQLLKILLYVQVDHSSYRRQQNRHILKSNIQLIADIKLGSPKSFYLHGKTEQDAQNLICYPDPIVHLKYQGIRQTKDDFSNMSAVNDIQESLWPKEYKNIKQDPQQPASKTRQHQIYSKISTKPNIGVQNYLGISSMRVGLYTQIPMLLNQLKYRKIKVNTTSKKQLNSLHIIWKSLAQLKAQANLQLIGRNFNPQVQKQIKNYIQQFLQTYLKQWTSQDFLSLPAVGPVLCLLFQIAYYQNYSQFKCNYIKNQTVKKQQRIKCHPVFANILTKIKIRIKVVEEDNQMSSPNPVKYSNNCLNQAFLCLGGLCCFKQPIIIQNDQIAVDYLQLLFLYKFKMTYVEYKTNQYQAIKNYQHIMQLSIENNIIAILQYFKKNANQLTRIIKNIDEGINQNTSWKYCPQKSQFGFKGVNNFAEYHVDIKTGKILINGSPPSQISRDFRNNQYFGRMFGERNFQVYKAANNSEYITRKNFKDLFIQNIQEGQKVLFSFNYTKQYSTTINMLIRSDLSKQQQRWSLLNHKQLIKCLDLPQIFTSNYLPWICPKRKCIIFRKDKLQQMHEIGLVIFYDSYQISDVHIISKQHSKGPLNIVCDKQSKYFNKLILRAKSKKDSPAYKVLNLIQNEKYILQVKSINDGYRKLWLHRYDMSFIQRQNQGLIPENYQDYKVTLDKIEYIPWNTKQIPSLLLKKNKVHELSVSLHQIKIIVAKHTIFSGQTYGDIPHKKMDLYTYDLHDHIHKILGNNRESQMFLAAILAKIGKKTDIDRLYINHIDYSLNCLQSCLNNTFLTSQQLRILNKIQEFAKCLKNQPLILTCHALLLMTKQLLRLTQQETLAQKYTSKCQNKDYKYYISKCMKQYEYGIKNGTIPHRQRLKQQICEILGLKFTNESMYSKSKLKRWSQIYPLKLQIVSQFEGTISQTKQTLQKYRKAKQKILSNIQENEEEFQNKSRCPIDLRKYQKSSLVEQVMIELQESYKAHLQDQKHTFKIKLKKQDFNDFKNFQKQFKQRKKQIQDAIDKIRAKNQDNINVVCAYRPVISSFDFTIILTQPQKIKHFYPEISQENKQQLIEILKMWVYLTVQLDSCKRVLIHLDQYQKLDKVTLLRQLQSPRQEIQPKLYWVCFEVEMKLQIWISQYQTFLHLMGNETLKNQSVPQLNMGEGKTQIIIPMIVLQMQYGPKNFKKYTPRINLLSSIFQESKANYFRFFSMTSFNISILELPFVRQVQILNDQVMNSIRRVFKYFKGHMIILLDQSSIHSLILKLRQASIKQNGNFNCDKQQTVFRGIQCIDIYDQVDAQMTPKKSFVYSIGKQEPLQHLRFRCMVPQLLISLTCELIDEFMEEGIIVFDETQQKVKKSLGNGQYPKGLRLTSTLIQNPDKQNDIKEKLVDKIIINSSNHQQLSFIKNLSENNIVKLKKYLLQDQQSLSKELSENISEGALNIIYNIRGFIAHGIYIHCMLLRGTVNYGIPDQQRVRKTKKRLAIPYQASNVASKKNDFAQPDVAIMLTYLAYFYTGIQYNHMIQAIQKLFDITKGNEQAQNHIFKSWVRTLNEQNKEYLKVDNSGQIKLDSNSQMTRFYQVFKMNRKFIRFWLQNCVFAEDMGQYLNSITSSTWDHSSVKNSIGFSGTKDMHRLFPHYLHYEQSTNNRIRGTDGKMLEMLLEHTLDIKQIPQGPMNLWQKFLTAVLDLPQEYNISCVIDVGALLAGNSLKNEIVIWLSKNPKFNKKFKGISFCHENKWEVYQFSNFEYVKKGTSLPDHQTFVIFDEYRTRGADMKMSTNMTGAISLGPNLTKDNLMQAAGRLRKIGRNQKLVILMTKQVKKKIKDICQYSQQMTTKQKVQTILNWTCLNSIKQTQKFFLQNSKLAKIHLLNKQIQPGQIPNIDRGNTSLKNMYSFAMKYRSIHDLSLDMFKEIQHIHSAQKELILKQTQKFTSNIVVKSQKHDQIRERETQLVVQTQNIKEFEHLNISPIPQEYNITPLSIRFQNLKYKFDNKLKISKNFKKCTAYSNSSINHFPTLYGRSNDRRMNKEQDDNQLQLSYFVYLNPEFICMITIRQANYLLTSDKKVSYFPIKQQNEKQLNFYNYEKQYVACLSDLTIQNPYIDKNKLKSALVQCKYYNGYRSFTNSQKNILRSFLYVERNNEEKISFFLIRRRIQQYYKNSSLHKLQQEMVLMNQAPDPEIQ